MIAFISIIDIAVVALYFVAMIAIGAALSRKQTSTDEYFLGKRKMHWLIVGISIQATMFSTISYLAVPGEQIKNGLGYLIKWLSEMPAE